jgi:hypothetical protein
VCALQYLEEILKYCNYVFTCIFVIEALLKLVAFGLHRFFKERCIFDHVARCWEGEGLKLQEELCYRAALVKMELLPGLPI